MPSLAIKPRRGCNSPKAVTINPALGTINISVNNTAPKPKIKTVCTKAQLAATKPYSATFALFLATFTALCRCYLSISLEALFDSVSRDSFNAMIGRKNS